MSFIDKALEKAKALGKEKKKDEVPAAAETLPRRIPLTGRTGFAEREVIPPEFSYTVTRVVPVNPEVMRRNRLTSGGGEVETAVTEGYKLLRTHILQRTKAKDHNTLMIAGPQSGEGKTLTAINLAISIAQDVNQTVLLVDADLRSPSIHRFFGIPRGEGLVDHLTAGVPISELLIHPEGVGKLILLPGGKPVARAAELISSPLMADLVQELKHFYANRYIIFDLPPLLNFADALSFAPLVDGIVVVVEAGRTAKEDIERCQKILKAFNVLGFVLNKLDVLQQSYYYSSREERASNKKQRFSLFK